MNAAYLLQQTLRYPLESVNGFNKPGSACLLALLFTSLLLISTSALAEDETTKSRIEPFWLNQSQINLLPEPRPQLTPQCPGIFFQGAFLVEDEAGDAGEQSISADKALYQVDGTSRFEGNVIVRQAQQQISSDAVYYHHKSNALELIGNVMFQQEGLLITSNKAKHDISKEQLELESAEFLIFETAINGTAQRILLSENNMLVHQSSMSSCPPGQEHWILKSHELYLDQESGWGYARNASLHLGQVPVFYTPYFTFPIDDRRKSGFLYPEIGRDSINGADIAVPYYFNIAPNYDATLTGRVLSKRGNQLAGEFRYLNPLGYGQLSGDYLGKDRLNTNYSERKQARWKHQAQYQENWFFNADYFYLSDPDYLDDLDSFSGNKNLGYVERSATLDYFQNNVYFSVLAQDFQVLDDLNPLDEPYRLAPQINTGVRLPIANSAFSITLSEQLSRFERDIDNTLVAPQAIANGEISTGIRNVFIPELRADFSGAGYFVKPSVALHHRNYALEDYQALSQTESIERSIPIYSLDSGLIFERPIQVLNNDYKQTLEPHMLLVKIPYKDQGDIPNFDSSLLTLTSSQLFRTRRYSGNDVLGDTEHASLSLSSKLYDQSQSERADFTVGQILYFRDREIQLDPSEDPTAEQSPLLASMRLSILDNWSFRQAMQWDSAGNRLEQFSTLISFRADNNRIANLEYRYRPESSQLAQAETRASLVWPLNNRWKLLSYWNFDLNQDSTIELASGLEYENCCLIVRGMNQKWLRKLSNNDYESANKQSIELQLKGLGRMNDQFSDYFKNRIPGYNM